MLVAEGKVVCPSAPTVALSLANEQGASVQHPRPGHLAACDHDRFSILMSSDR
jgi:hypothetical protein